MRYRSKTNSMRVILRLIVGLTASLFVLGLSNVQNAEGFNWHKGRYWRAEPVSCGMELKDGYFELTGDLSCTGQTSITISGPAKLNLKGYTLSGVDGKNDCILITGVGASIWNGTVENCRDGIEIELQSDRNTIIHVKSCNNKRRGFRIMGDKNFLFNCSATNNGRQGIKIEGFIPDPDKPDDPPQNLANGNKIFFSKAYANCRDGIEIEAGNDNCVFYNQVKENGKEATCIASGGTYKPWFYAGIDVLSPSENNKIKYNHTGCNLGCFGTDDLPCTAHERNFWDENVEDGLCVSTNEWENNSIWCNNALPECSPNPKKR